VAATVSPGSTPPILRRGRTTHAGNAVCMGTVTVPAPPAEPSGRWAVVPIGPTVRPGLGSDLEKTMDYSPSLRQLGTSPLAGGWISVASESRGMDGPWTDSRAQPGGADPG
jgi:hypothetical protein